MDAMALLCNVHADGPATRSLLSAAGCESLQDLLAIPPEELAGILGSTPAFARRLLLEARELTERESSLLERDEEGAAIRLEAATAPPGPAGSRSVATRTATPAAPQSLRPGLLAGLDATCCERLASRGVSTLDALAQAPGLELARETGLPYPRLAELQCLARGSLSTTPALRPEPRGGGAPAGEPLRPGLLEGLDEARCRRLADCGVTTFEALVDAAGLRFANRLGLSYPRLLDLQHLARRYLATTLRPVPQSSAKPTPRPWEAPRMVPSPIPTGPTVSEPGSARARTARVAHFDSREAEARPDPGPSGPFC